MRFHRLDRPADSWAGYTQDLAGNGLFITSRTILPPKCRLVIEVETEAGPVCLTGTVVWARRAPVGLAAAKRHGMGVRLDAPCPELAADADPSGDS